MKRQSDTKIYSTFKYEEIFTEKDILVSKNDKIFLILNS